MSFLFPSMLFGLVVLAIPLIIHFFNFQRAKRVEFTNVELLRTIKEVTNSRNKLKNLLVLLCRMLVLACLVIAFARPFIPQNEAAGVEMGKHVSIYLDNSFSMENERDGSRLKELAVNLTEQITQAFPQTTTFQLLDNRFEGSMSYFAEASRIADKLTEQEFSNSGRSLSNVWDRQQNALQNANSGKGNQVFWLSDFQKNNSPDLADLRLDSAQNFHLIPLSPNATRTIFVDSVWLSVPFIKVQENSTLNVKISNGGNEPVEDKLVKLFIGDRQVSSTTVTLAANASETLVLNFAVTEGGQKMGRITLEDFPVVFDNEYYFTLKVAPKISIVSVVGDEERYVERVYSNEPFFEVKRYSINALDYAALRTADLIVLSNLKEIDEGLRVALTKATEGGASLAVFPSASADPSSYGRLLGLAMQPNTADASADRQQIRVPEASNPFFEGVFEKVQQNMNMPAARPSLRWNRTGETLLRFKNGQDFLTRIQNRGQNLFVFATPLSTEFSDFPKHAVFVPIMYKIALASKNESERLAYSFSDEVASLSLAKSGKDDVYKLVREGFEFIPSQRISDQQLLINIPKSGLEAGNYRVVNAKTSEQVGMVAFNYSSEESDLAYYTAEELKAAFAGQENVTIYEEVDFDQFGRSFQEQTHSNQLWRAFLIAALLFLLLETLLLRFWKK